MKQVSKAFGEQNEEKAELNQYWYSPYTIKQMTDEVMVLGGKVAFLSTPSLYFSIPEQSRSDCYVFDYDKSFDKDPRFVFYDYNFPDQFPSELMNTFDVVVIDPPFITEEVWRKYATTAKSLLKVDGGKAILTTISENEPLLKSLFNARATAFQPSIPNLVYQYSLFTNYESTIFSQLNPEIPQ